MKLTQGLHRIGKKVTAELLYNPKGFFSTKNLGNLLFAFVVVGTLTVLQLGRSAGLPFILLAAVFQLIGGTIFAIGLLGQGVQSVQAWVEKYFTFTREPAISLLPLQGAIAILATLTHEKGDRGHAILNFVRYGVVIVMTVTVLAHYVNLPKFLFSNHPRLVRPLCVIVGLSMYWAGVYLLGS